MPLPTTTPFGDCEFHKLSLEQKLNFLFADDGSGNPALKTIIENNGLNTGGFSEKLSLSVTTSSTAYAANDNIGGIQTLTNLLRTSGGTGILHELSFWTLANQKPNLLIDFWDASPSGTYTNDAPQVVVGDHGKWLGSAEISVSDWKDTGVVSRATKSSIGIILKGNASRNIFMTIQDKTGITLGSTSGMFYKVGVLQD